MKSIFYRLSRSFLLPIVLVVMFAFIVYYAYNIYRNTDNTASRWRNPIDDYTNTDRSIDVQLGEIEKNKQENLKILYEECAYADELDIYNLDVNNENGLSPKATMVIMEMQWQKESEDILRFLSKNNYTYDQIVDGSEVSGMLRSRYIFMLFTYDAIWKLDLVFALLIICLVVCIGRQNGAFLIETLTRGRKKVFWEQFGSGLIILAVIELIQFIFIFLVRLEFPNYTEYLLYYNHGNIKVVPEIITFIGFAVYHFVKTFVFYCIFFSLAYFIKNIIVMIGTSAAISFLYIRFEMVTAYTEKRSKILDALRISLVNVYDRSYLDVKHQAAFVLSIKIIGIIVVSVLFYIGYRIAMKKNLKTTYE